MNLRDLAAVEVENLSIAFGNLRVIQNFSMRFDAAQITCIMGPSGCGKTTLLNALAGLIEPVEGRITRRIALGGNNRCGFVFQNHTLLPWQTVFENSVFGAELAGIPPASSWSDARDLLGKFGLADFLDSYPSKLSGGMRQRVAIVRALVAKSMLLLLDEPFSDLDLPLRLRLQKVLAELVKIDRIVAVLVTHDVEEALRVSDRIVVLAGKPARAVADYSNEVAATARFDLERIESTEMAKARAKLLSYVLNQSRKL